MIYIAPKVMKRVAIPAVPIKSGHVLRGAILFPRLLIHNRQNRGMFFLNVKIDLNSQQINKEGTYKLYPCKYLSKHKNKCVCVRVGSELKMYFFLF